MNADLDALATELYVVIDDILIATPELVPFRPKIGIAPQLSDAELLTLAVLQALLGHSDEARFIRYAHVHLIGLFPYLPKRPAYNKRLRRSVAMLQGVVRILATRCAAWHDDVWLIDSTPVECGRSRETAHRSDLAGTAGYGYCASHSRYFWGLRLHLIATPAGLPIAYALTNPKDDERRGPRPARNRRPTSRPPRRTNHHRRQGLPLGRTRRDLDQSRREVDPTGVQNRTSPTRPTLPPPPPPDHRVDQPHPQSAARP